MVGQDDGPDLSAPDAASLPGVLDFLQHRRAHDVPEPDDADVFARYYQQHPEGGLAVFDE